MNRHFAKFAWFAVVCGFLALPGLSYADDGSDVRNAPAVAAAVLSCPATSAASVGAAPAVSEPIFLAARLCCLDEWQPGPCSSTQRYASQCTNACGTCGAFSCIPKTTPCLR